MPEIVITENIPSIVVDKEFLIELFKCINKCNPKSISVTTNITIVAEKEERTYKNLRDFLESSYLPKRMTALIINKDATNIKDENKIISFHFELNKESPIDSYFELIGLDEGKLEVCKKEVLDLIDRYKTWYGFIFFGINSEEDKSKGIVDIIGFLISVSLSVLIYNSAMFLFNNSPVILIIAIASLFLFLHMFGKIMVEFFSYMDLRLKEKKRHVFFNWLLGGVFVALLSNLVWEIIKLLVK
ncbi:MAG: hypothetical protein WC755_06380 [Candidatus Woesearchaeota archaeon]|jgi:hypothetical protein